LLWLLHFLFYSTINSFRDKHFSHKILFMYNDNDTRHNKTWFTWHTHEQGRRKEKKREEQTIQEAQLVAAIESNASNINHLREGGQSSHLRISSWRYYDWDFHRWWMGQSTKGGTSCVYIFLHGPYPTWELGQPHQKS